MDFDDIASKQCAIPIDRLEWEADVSVVTHPLMLAGFAKAFVIAVVLLGGLLAFGLAINGNVTQIVPMIGMTVTLGLGLFLFVLAIAFVFYRDRIHIRSSVDATGAKTAVVDSMGEDCKHRGDYRRRRQWQAGGCRSRPHQRHHLAPRRRLERDSPRTILSSLARYFACQ